MSAVPAASPEVTGLRKRFSSFKPSDGLVSPGVDFKMMHDKKDASRDHIEEEEEDQGSVNQSFSSDSSGNESNESGALRNGEDERAREAVGDQQDAEEESWETDSPRKLYRRASSSYSRSRTRFQNRQTLRTRSSNNLSRFGERTSSSGSGWFGYNLSIIVALVSPIGNLLTGGDHIKNVLLLLLLVYYLHQLVEVPWTLYRMSIPAQSLPSVPSTANSVRLSAHSELRSLELFYLVLTVVSPFLGATLLRFVARAITGNKDTLSWFSTALFVLATGLRPWSHLVERLKDRSRALNELLETETASESQSMKGSVPTFEQEIDEEINELRENLSALNTRVTDLASKNSHEWADLAEHVAEIVDGVEEALRRHRAELVRSSNANETRFAALELRMCAIDAHLAINSVVRRAEGQSPLRGEKLRNLFWEVVALPWTAAAAAWMYFGWVVPRLEFGTAMEEPERCKFVHSTSRKSTLEPIPEENVPLAELARNQLPSDDSDQTLIADTYKPQETFQGIPHRLKAAVKAVTVNIGSFLLSPFAFALRVAFLLIGIPRMISRALFA